MGVGTLLRRAQLNPAWRAPPLSRWALGLLLVVVGGQVEVEPPAAGSVRAPPYRLARPVPLGIQFSGAIEGAILDGCRA
jgi:hypothetical protein